jgi:riboflavin synthase
MKDKNLVPKANEVLNKNKNKFEHVIVIGLEGDKLNISSTVATYPFMHWTLNKAIFELMLHERQSQQEEKVAEVFEEEAPAAKKAK